MCPARLTKAVEEKGAGEERRVGIQKIRRRGCVAIMRRHRPGRPCRQPWSQTPLPKATSEGTVTMQQDGRIVTHIAQKIVSL